MQQWVLLIFWGFIAGMVGGAFGIGGGALIVPVLVLIFGVGQKSAQGLSLMAMLPMVIIGSLRYYFNPNIETNLKIALFIACGSVIGVLIGTEIVSRVPSAYLKKAFAILLILIAVKMFVSDENKDKNSDANDEALVSEME